MTTVDRVDQLARAARTAPPPPLTDREINSLLDRAVDEHVAPIATRRSIAWPLGLGLAVGIAMAVLAFGVLRHHESVAAADPRILRLTLPTGDRLTAIGGAQFDVERLDMSDRQLRLQTGLVLFDVAHVVPGQRFAVATPDLVATAKGTVFSVQTGASGSRVHVYEGVVEVTQGRATHVVLAGASWNSAADRMAVAIRPPELAPMIASAVAAHVATRAATAIASATVPPSVASPAALLAAAPSPPAPSRSAPPRAVPARIAATRSPASPDSVSELYARARTQVTAGELADALATSDLARTHGELDGSWWLLIGDASRSLGKQRDAADAYDRAARALAGADRAEAGYSAAYIRFHDLHEAPTALTSLDAASADSSGSPLEERALGLHAQILVVLGRVDEARPLATRYLARFPAADFSAWMRRLLAKH